MGGMATLAFAIGGGRGWGGREHDSAAAGALHFGDQEEEGAEADLDTWHADVEALLAEVGLAVAGGAVKVAGDVAGGAACGDVGEAHFLQADDVGGGGKVCVDIATRPSTASAGSRHKVSYVTLSIDQVNYSSIVAEKKLSLSLSLSLSHIRTHLYILSPPRTAQRPENLLELCSTSKVL
ncbi:hypothetical protein GOP47_0027883 [Adiantum capillus-veneris]|nr:hypothetical protein GOP47_0027883 [Adiantum capillus-veneris]